MHFRSAQYLNFANNIKLVVCILHPLYEIILGKKYFDLFYEMSTNFRFKSFDVPRYIMLLILCGNSEIGMHVWSVECKLFDLLKAFV